MGIPAGKLVSTRTDGAELIAGILTAANENLVCAILISQLRSIALTRLELDGDLGVVEKIGAFKDDTKAALTNLLAHTVVDTNDIG